MSPPGSEGSTFYVERYYDQRGDVPPTDAADIYAKLERLARAQYGMRRRHVFGNISLDAVAGNIPQMPLEDIYVEPMATRVAIGRQKVARGRRPALELVTELLSSHHLVAIDQGFGAGKSLTARTLVWQLSRRWLESESKEDEYLPILIRCADTMYQPNRGEPIASFLGGGLSGLTSLLECGGANITLANLKHHEKVIWVLDGLDELTLPIDQLSAFYFMLHTWPHSNNQHRFVVTARTTVAQEALKLVSSQAWFERNAARVALHYFNAGQRNQWLSQWGSILAVSPNTTCEIKSPDHERLVQDELYKVPLLLFMGAISGSDDEGAPRSKAVLYEHFCTWVAVGKWHEQLHAHTPAGQGLIRLAEHTTDGAHAALKPIQEVLGFAPEEELRRGISHALYILSRLAWESVVIEQGKKWSGDVDIHDHDALPLAVVERLLNELGYTSEESATKADRLVLDTVLLNAMGTKQGGANTFLFGHKSFREYLAVRYHLSVFLYMAENNIRSSEPSRSTLIPTLLEAIGRGDLLDYSEATHEFVSDIGSLPQLEGRTKILHDWCMAEVSDPAMVAPVGKPVRLQTDLRASWRFSSLGIRAAMLDADETSPVSSMQALNELFAIHRTRNSNSNRAGNDLVAEKLNLKGSTLSKIVLIRTNLRGTDLSEADLREADLRGADLSGADLNRANLAITNLNKANLNCANLNRANLNKADLSGATLRGADLSEADLSEANLRGADLSEADLSEANLSEADLSGANLNRANLAIANLAITNMNGAKLNEANLSKTNLRKTNLRGADLREAKLCVANLTMANLSEANLNRADLSWADLSWADLHGTKLIVANLHNAKLRVANLREANLSEANLSKTDLNGANLREANLRKAYLAHADLTGANLENANLEDAKLEDANLEGAKFEDANLKNSKSEDINLANINIKNANLAGINLAGINLAGANLEGANLENANFTGANLNGANLNRANLAIANVVGANLAGFNLANINLANINLVGAELADFNLAGLNLAGADLEDANLAGINLSGANLTGANLKNANLENANLENANLENANLEGAKLEGADLGGANLTGAELKNANLAGINLANAKLAGINLTGLILAGANLEGANLADANLSGTNLKNTDLKNANIEGINLANINLANIDLAGINLEGANLEGANLEGANLEGANLAGANLENANFTGANLGRAKLIGPHLELTNFGLTKSGESGRARVFHARINTINASLEGANLVGVYFDRKTQWPVYIDPIAEGAILVEKEEG
jgi:uncharacterized protein YjbI with pentapeptide repeats